MLSRRDGRGELFFHDKRSQWQSRGNGLGNGDHVRGHPESLEGKNRARASQAALNFVEDQRRTVTIGQRSTFA